MNQKDLERAFVKFAIRFVLLKVALYVGVNTASKVLRKRG